LLVKLRRMGLVKLWPIYEDIESAVDEVMRIVQSTPATAATAVAAAAAAAVAATGSTSASVDTGLNGHSGF